MQQIGSVWAGLDWTKRGILVGAVLAVFLGILGLSRMASTPNMQLLYSGLNSSAAGDIVQELEGQGAIYKVRGDAIYVEANQRDALRMKLAGEGLPANGGRGYELLDSLNGFATTSQMFDAAYWRAKEGELARTLVAAPYIKMARVHIAQSATGAFQRSSAPKASVSLTAAGLPITTTQADAVRYLVASAVRGMSVDSVAVIDANGTLIGSGDPAAAGANQTDLADDMRKKVLRLLEARVGPGNAVVEVSVDTVTHSETIRETRIDPESRVAISSDVEERSDNSTSAASAVTVASNLPDGDASGSDNNESQANETRERVNYEVSQTQKEIQRGPGDIERLTVAVLVNKIAAEAGPDTATFADRSPEELDDLRELVASTVGFDEARGDVITLKSMEMPTPVATGTVASASAMDRLNLDAMSLIQLSVLAAVTLAISMFVVKPLLSQRPAVTDFADGQLQLGVAAQGDQAPALNGEVAAPGEDLMLAAAKSGSLPATQASQSQIDAAPVERLRAMIGDKQEETVEILRSWLEEEKKENA